MCLNLVLSYGAFKVFIQHSLFTDTHWYHIDISLFWRELILESVDVKGYPVGILNITLRMRAVAQCHQITTMHEVWVQTTPETKNVYISKPSMPYGPEWLKDVTKAFDMTTSWWSPLPVPDVITLWQVKKISAFWYVQLYLKSNKIEWHRKCQLSSPLTGTNMRVPIQKPSWNVDFLIVSICLLISSKVHLTVKPKLLSPQSMYRLTNAKFAVTSSFLLFMNIFFFNSYSDQKYSTNG